MTTFTRKWPWIVTTLLLTACVGEGVWISRQQQQLQAYQITEVRILFGNMAETINAIDVFANTKDRAELKDLYVRLWWLHNEAFRLQEVLQVEQPPFEMLNRTTPSGLVSLIQMHNIETEMAIVYLKQVQAKLREYQQRIDASTDEVYKFTQFLALWNDLTALADQKRAEWQLP